MITQSVENRSFEESVALLALGAALMVPALAMLWRSASLRGDMFNKWAERIDITYAGLSEHAVQLLRQLQKDIDDLLGDPDAKFNPDLAIVDPAPMASLTSKFERALAARRRIRRRFRAMITICAITPFIVVLFIIGALLVFGFYADWHDVDPVRLAGFVAAAVAVVAGTVVVIGYVYLNWRLTTAEIMARPPSGTEREEGGWGG